MNFKIIVFLSFLSLIAISCSTCKTGKKKSMNDELEKITDPKFKHASSKSVPLGAVKIRAKINSDNVETDAFFHAKIVKVVKRGRGAPIVNSDEYVKVKFSDKQKEVINKLGPISTITIKSLPSGKNTNGIDVWQLITVE